MRVVDKAFLAACMVVAGSTAALPFVRGYGTGLLQLVVLGAWAIIAKLSSGTSARARVSVQAAFSRCG
jgi:hypothetical protein